MTVSEMMALGKNLTTLEIAPLVVVGIITFFWITGEWKQDKILFVSINVSAVCLVLIAYGKVEEAVIGSTVSIFVLVVFSVFFRKKYCKKEG